MFEPGMVHRLSGRNRRGHLISGMEIMLMHSAILMLCCRCFFLIVSCDHISTEMNLQRSAFPSNFLFGTASSSYQYEGAFLQDGKGLSNWDVFAHKPGNIIDGSNGDVADDHYHLYPEDLDLMDDVGVNSYRFSLSWARILPKGRFGEVNMAGVNHYNKMIDAMVLKGIEPFVTLTHYDTPQELESRYGGWLSPEMKTDFEFYADICFKYFGDRVKLWATFNEPNVQVRLGYRDGTYPPGRCSGAFGRCPHGDSETEPFIAGHNIILAHISAVSIYRRKYQKEQGGKIGIVVNSGWFEPVSDSLEDKLAVERALAFTLGWFLDPIMFGKYPDEMQDLIGSNLPIFSADDMKNFNNGLDFIGINHYTSTYVESCLHTVCEPGKGGSKTEGLFKRNVLKQGHTLGELTGVDWLYAYPPGMEKIVLHTMERYNNTPMYITENGFGENSTAPLIQDTRRVGYISSYLNSLERAMRKGADVRGYFAWSLLDNFEWSSGYTIRFGLYHVDYATQKRSSRLSARWYRNFISNHRAQTQTSVIPYAGSVDQ